MKPQETAQERAEKTARAEKWCEEKNGEHLDPRDFYPRPESVEAFIAGEESAQPRIKTLESALVDMAKALEIATTYGFPPHDVSGREEWLSIYETKKLHQELLSEIRKGEK